MTDIFSSLSDSTGLPSDQIRMVTGFLLTIPFGFFFKALNGRFLRMTISTIYGLLLSYMVYDYKIVSIFIQTAIVYFLTKILKRKAPYIVFAETLIFVSAHHIYRQIYDYGGWTLDVTTILMMNTPKWTSFAFCISDGTKDASKLNNDQNERKITKFPSFYEFFSYIFFYASAVAGPAFDYYDFDNFINQSGVYRIIPSTYKETLKKVRNAIIASLFTILLAPKFELDYIVTEEYGQQNFFYKILYMNIMITLLRTKYVSGWSFTEAGMASCGFTYNGVHTDGSHQWDRIQQINVLIDLTYNPKDKVENWNISIQNWLRRYVYMRIYDEEALKKSVTKQNNAQMITYLVSAFWHGFYPGYYTSFIQWGFTNQLSKAFYRMSVNTPYLNIFETNIVMKFIRFYSANTIFNTFGCAFQLLSIERNLKFYSNIYWIPNIVNFGGLLFFTLTGFGQKKKSSSSGPRETKKEVKQE